MCVFYNSPNLEHQKQLTRVCVCFVQQCVSTLNFPFEFLNVYQRDARAVRDSVTALINAMERAGLNSLRQSCGPATVTRLTLHLTDLQQWLTILVERSQSSLGFVNCRLLSALYVDTAYDATCRQSVRGLTWGFATSIMVGFAGLLMITLRASWLAEQDLFEMYHHQQQDHEDKLMADNDHTRNDEDRRRQERVYHNEGGVDDDEEEYGYDGFDRGYDEEPVLPPDQLNKDGDDDDHDSFDDEDELGEGSWRSAGSRRRMWRFVSWRSNSNKNRRQQSSGTMSSEREALSSDRENSVSLD